VLLTVPACQKNPETELSCRHNGANGLVCKQKLPACGVQPALPNTLYVSLTSASGSTLEMYVLKCVQSGEDQWTCSLVDALDGPSRSSRPQFRPEPTPSPNDPSYQCDVNKDNNQLVCFVSDQRPDNAKVPATLSLLVALPGCNNKLVFVCAENGQRLACLPDPKNAEPTSSLNGLVAVLPSPEGDRKYQCANNGLKLVCLLEVDESTLVPSNVVQLVVPGNNNEKLGFNCVLNCDNDLNCDPEDPNQPEPCSDVDYAVVVPTDQGDQDYLCTYADNVLVCRLDSRTTRVLARRTTRRTTRRTVKLTACQNAATRRTTTSSRTTTRRTSRRTTRRTARRTTRRTTRKFCPCNKQQ
jgi:hypothetical protein